MEVKNKTLRLEYGIERDHTPGPRDTLTMEHIQLSIMRLLAYLPFFEPTEVAGNIVFDCIVFFV